ncbi:L,D-transpeptidase family protein [Sphingomonas piscis]|uniref:L,D-transpeptidase family protein n=2 Tax=Sphingomonas piscis TaxID=2714943 RepID=A0A6G7YTI8_9SPHN|nr:L,D-transpeptidase family protein [Sphingomonas piscis]
MAVAVAAPVFAATLETPEQPALVAAVPVAAAPDAEPVTPAEPVVAADPFAAEIADKGLKPGDFVWREGAAGIEGPVGVTVSISDQRAYVYRGETLVAVSTVSTGKPGHRTPTGTFPITEKRAVHFSSKYDNAPMPHMQRLTNDGVALHAGRIPGHPASHGCVRLPAKFAADLFKVTRRGTPVTITL